MFISDDIKKGQPDNVICTVLYIYSYYFKNPIGNSRLLVSEMKTLRSCPLDPVIVMSQQFQF